MIIPFDNECRGKYQIELHPELAEHGDGIVLVADKEGFLALADVFRQLAEHPTETHIHLGYTNDCLAGPGWKLVRIGGRL